MKLLKHAPLGITFLAMIMLLSNLSFGQTKSNHGNKFEQLGTMLRPGNDMRGMDGAPGPAYWQQRADYDIECTLDEKELRLDGTEKITYYNQSPHTLRYLWLQLDENQHATESDAIRSANASSMSEVMSGDALERIEDIDREKYGHKIHQVLDEVGKPLPYTINQTMMRVELPQPLKSGETFTFHVDWHYYLVPRIEIGGRGGYEYFEDTEDHLFTITQWYPRMCAYSDVEGWQNKQFTGRGEFALSFGNFVVKMTVPDDHVVGSTGECLNYPAILTPTQLKRWEQAKTAEEPIEIVTLAEAKANEKTDAKGTKTWIYKADNVRDFAWTSSRKFVWDAMPHITEEGKRVMCMSYYGKEAYPIYSRYSTKVVAHTLKTYSKYSFPYPYPVAISVEGRQGMEYPMICFNPGRAEEDGTYTERSKNSAILVIIHEVGHNYFPMIVNSDERQWTWMDEGINTFLHETTFSEFDNDYRPAFTDITDYMRLPKNQLEPIMTNSENIVMPGPNAYGKPAAGLSMLRETIMGRELFDYAFKEYARRWMFKNPTPADFFRTMEDASGVDLDWFWRGWFYGIEPVDISLDSVKWYKVDLENNPEPVEQRFPQTFTKPERTLTQERNREEGIEFAVEQDEELRDFYDTYKPWETEDSVQTFERTLYAETFTEKEKKERFGDKNYYELAFSNKGGLVMPVIIEWTFEDGTTEIERIPAEIWRKNENEFTKVFVKTKEVTAIRIDPYKETADIDESNNNWPVRELPNRFQVFKQHKSDQMNPMQKAIKAGKIIKP